MEVQCQAFMPKGSLLVSWGIVLPLVPVGSEYIS